MQQGEIMESGLPTKCVNMPRWKRSNGWWLNSIQLQLQSKSLLGNEARIRNDFKTLRASVFHSASFFLLLVQTVAALTKYALFHAVCLQLGQNIASWTLTLLLTHQTQSTPRNLKWKEKAHDLEGVPRARMNPALGGSVDVTYLPLHRGLRVKISRKACWLAFCKMQAGAVGHPGVFGILDILNTINNHEKSSNEPLSENPCVVAPQLCIRPKHAAMDLYTSQNESPWRHLVVLFCYFISSLSHHLHTSHEICQKAIK